MQTKRKNVGRRAWNIIRLAVLWARKNAESRRVFVMDLGKCFSRRRSDSGAALRYGEREMSFHSSPVNHVKMHRAPPLICFNIPCIKKPAVDRFHNDDVEYCLYDDDVEYCLYDDDDDEDDVDVKAEMFITKFYEQIKIQRQGVNNS
ncbi:uncharacterized protein LOC124929910 [Impatiens glandulifera]|uniref:uncharacterized protein LOC124929910 n=1 Tax=Impatiens glandulifera TaxID=253017 RepID=UPI001FB19D70|nr:uncharacterized protein LOC124929910 [Impatiens glandulifera]